MIVIGKYTIREDENGTIWIEKPDGEGSQFSIELFEKLIDGFFAKYF